MTQEIKAGKLLYRLGHQPHLGVLEYNSLTDERQVNIQNWIASDTLISPNKTGSLIFVSKVISVLEKKAAEKEILNALEQSLTGFSEGVPKKIGVSGINSKESMQILKKAGCKKINQILDLPSFGHWKQTHNWILVHHIEDQIVISIILEYADQQFWRYLDENLPAGEMSRGLMNLKLARTMLNLTSKKIIYDPFAGFGRLAVGGLDIKKQFLFSDIDGEILANDVKSNLDFAELAWNKYLKRHDPENLTQLAKHDYLRSLDAIHLDNAINFWPDVSFQEVAIVTEGYLGKNFKQKPTEDQVKLELDSLKNLWYGVLKHSYNLGISSLVFCLPAYILEHKMCLADWLDEIVSRNNYKNLSLKPIIYTRKNSLVAHQIVILSV